jgi:hypothetical protein
MTGSHFNVLHVHGTTYLKAALMVEAFSVSLVASTIWNQTIPEQTNNR